MDKYLFVNVLLYTSAIVYIFSVTKPGLLDKHMSRYLHLKVPVLGEKLDIIGGNHTGIFITAVHFPTTEFAEGDQIKSVSV